MADRKMGRPTADTEPQMVRMSKVVLEQLDECRRNVPGLPSRPALIRQIVEEWLASDYARNLMKNAPAGDKTPE